MLLKMLIESATLLYIVIAGVIVIAAVCIYFYYRISKKDAGESAGEEDESAPSYDYADDINAGVPQFAADNVISMPEFEEGESEPPQEEIPEITEEAEPQTEELPQEEIPKIIDETEAQTVETQQAESAAEEAQNRYINDKGECIEISEEDGGYVFSLKSKKGEVLGKSGVYQTRAGLVKSFKSFANYKDTKVYDITITANDFKITKFELFSGDDGKYCYHLKTKNSKVKFSGCGFKSKSDCLSAIDKVKNITESFAVEE